MEARDRHTHAGQVTVARLNQLSLGELAGHRRLTGSTARASGQSPARVRSTWTLGSAQR
ncbi:hypothetical protein [Sorangium sp. So ce1335]|uniref:hypothetical protein n=1 Tax=Sorangium sp. So ce1335 TaxID=3133335 RepID=UPI003F6215C9